MAGSACRSPTARRPAGRASASSASSRGTAGVEVQQIAALAATALVAVGAGVSIGSLIAPDVTAAEGPWGSASSPSPAGSRCRRLALPGRPAGRRDGGKCPFAEDDVVNGLAEPSSLPYSTLPDLPPRGIVIVATFIAVDTQFPGSTLFLPGRVAADWGGDAVHRERDADPPGSASGPVPTPRCDGRLERRGERVLRDSTAVGALPRCGPAPARRLLTRPAPTPKRTEIDGAGSGSGPASTSLDRTFACTPGPRRPAHRRGACPPRDWSRRGRDGAPGVARSAPARGAAASAVENNVAWISAGGRAPRRPSLRAT